MKGSTLLPSFLVESGKCKVESGVIHRAQLHVDFVAKIKIVAGEFLSNLVEQIVL